MTPRRDEAFLDTAATLGRRLCRDALWAGDRCNWLGDSIEPVGGAWRVVHRVLGPELYGGTSGVALFLAALHRLTGEAPFRRTAEGAMAHAISRAEDIPPALRIAFYSGWTGLAYVLATAGAAFDRADLVERAYALIAAAARDAGAEPGFDVMVGAAGAIPALLSLQSRERPDDLMPIANRLGVHLVANARKSDAGWSWKTLEGQTERDATGFSHGVAGIAWALLELFAATGNTRFRDAAERGLRGDGVCHVAFSACFMRDVAVGQRASCRSAWPAGFHGRRGARDRRRPAVGQGHRDRQSATGNAYRWWRSDQQ